MELPTGFYIATNSILVAAGAIALWRRGRYVLALWLGLAMALHFAGMQYIVHSKEVPGFTEPLSFTYKLFDLLTNFSYIAFSAAVMAVCWHISPPKPNNSLKRDPVSGSACHRAP